MIIKNPGIKYNPTIRGVNITEGIKIIDANFLNLPANLSGKKIIPILQTIAITKIFTINLKFNITGSKGAVIKKWRYKHIDKKNNIPMAILHIF